MGGCVAFGGRSEVKLLLILLRRALNVYVGESIYANTYTHMHATSISIIAAFCTAVVVVDSTTVCQLCC